MSTQIEAQIETGLRTALRAQLDLAEITRGLMIACVWLARAEGEADKAQIPGIWINTQPYIPDVFSADDIGAIGKCAVTVSARVNPSDDPERAMLTALWGVVRDICYKGAFSFSGGVTMGGRVVVGTESGTDENGVFASVTMDVSVSVS